MKICWEVVPTRDRESLLSEPSTSDGHRPLLRLEIQEGLHGYGAPLGYV